MKTQIFIRSYAKDFQWLSYALRSIAKFCTGFSGVTVAVPETDVALADSMFSVQHAAIHSRPHGPKGMLEGMLDLCRCDEIVPSDTTHVLLTDSDCIFTCPTTPQDYTISGKPIMIGERFADMPADAGCQNWRRATEKALGFDPEYEFMTRHPALYPVWLFPLFREAVEKHTGRKFDEYVLSGRNEWPQEFAELTSLGAFARMYYPNRFAIIRKGTADVCCDADSGNLATMNHLKAFWSHAGVKDHVAELEKILA